MKFMKKYLVCLAAIYSVSMGCLAGEVTIEVRGDVYAPSKLWVASPGMEEDSKAWIELIPAGIQSGNRSAVYKAELASGRYSVVAADMVTTENDEALGAYYIFPPPFSVFSSTTASVRTLRAQAAFFDVTEESLDLGQVEFMPGDLLALMVRNGKGKGWVLPGPGDDEDPYIQMLRSKLRWVSLPRETPEGGWLTLASGNRMLARRADGSWSRHSVMKGGSPRLVSPVTEEIVVIAGEGPQIEWRRLDGAAVERLGTAGLPPGLMEALHCDAERRCAAGLLTESSVSLYYTADARSAEWKNIAVIEKLDCKKGCVFSARFHSMPGEILSINGSGATTRVRLADGAIESGVLPFRYISSFYNKAMLTARDNISADGGRVWREINTPTIYGNTQFDGSGRIFTNSTDFNFKKSYVRPTIRRSEAEGSRWPEISYAPTSGEYVVGGASSLQYIRHGNNLWVSYDAGSTWQRDRDFFAILDGKRSEK